MQLKFNPLIDNLPETVEVNEYIYTINTDFRYVLKYFAYNNGDDTDNNKLLFGLSMFYGNNVYEKDIPCLIKKLSWFINKGIEKEEEDEEEEKKRLFDILEDSGRIYSAFMQTYKINLRKVKMHWWVFLELFEGLPHGTHLSDVIDIRGRKFEKGMSAADRNALAKAQQYYRIGEAVDPMDVLFSAVRSISNGKS